jgi:hypothetical protein
MSDKDVVTVQEEGMDEPMEFRADNVAVENQDAQVDAARMNHAEFSATEEYARTVPSGPNESYAVYEYPEFIESLPQDQQKAISDLRANIPLDLTPEERCWWDARALRRFLVAREWNVKKATDMMLECIKWRHEYKPWEVKPEDVEEEFLKWTKMYRHGFTKGGQPVLYVVPTGKTSEQWDIQLNHLVFNLENAFATMDASKGVEQIVWIVNWAEFSLSDAAPLSFGRTVLSVLQNMYPERLNCFFCMDAPFYFRAVWTVLSPVINANTKKKIHFLTGSIKEGSSKYKKMLEVFDLDQLEVPFCGTNQYKLTPDIYWEKSKADYVRRQELVKQRVENFLNSEEGRAYVSAQQASNTQ